MDIAYHIGMHCTDDEALIRCLLRNKGKLLHEGIVVPGTGRYRPVLREALKTLRGAPAGAEMQQTMLDAILDEDSAERVVMSYDSFLCAQDKVIGEGMLYPMTTEKSPWFAQLFPGARSEFHLAIRNPATFLPALFARLSAKSYDEVMAGTDPLELSWSDFVRRLRDANPGMDITVWCDEDTPLIWPEVLAAVSGHGPEIELDHIYHRLGTLMSEDGMQRMLAYLEANPPASEESRRRVVTAFLDKYVMPEALELELDLPGWTDALVEDLSANYDDDIAEIAALDGVRLIQP